MNALAALYGQGDRITEQAWKAVLVALKKACALPVGSPERDAALREHRRLGGVAQLKQIDFNRRQTAARLQEE